MIRLLFYTDTTMVGGTENHMFLLAKFLPKDTFQITVALLNNRRLDFLCQKFIEIGCRVVRLKGTSVHDPRQYFSLRKIIKDFDIIHLHVWSPLGCKYAFLAAGNKPVVVTEHDTFEISKFVLWLKKRLTKHAAAIIVPSQGFMDIVERQHPNFSKSITMIHNGIDIDAWRKAGKLIDRALFRKQYFNARPNDVVILCAAQLFPRKSQNYLIEACGKLSEENSTIILALLGEGPLELRYRKLAASYAKLRIHFLGFSTEVAKFMAAADLFVLPSIRESLGLVLLEAAASKLPVIATQVGGIPEVIHDQETGLLVPPADSESLKKAILTILNDYTLRARCIKNATQQLEKSFTASRMAYQTMTVYNKVLESK